MASRPLFGIAPPSAPAEGGAARPTDLAEDSPESGSRRVLSVRSVSKRYGANWALREVSYGFAAGRVYGLIGLNGSGKSTLMKIIAGAERATRGELIIAGRVERPRSVSDAAQLGVSLVPQELPVAPALDVAENIYLGRLPTACGVVRTRALRQAARKTLADLGVSLDVTRPAGDLSLGEQQLVVIARTLHRHAQVVLLDEPTSALGAREVAGLLERIRGLAAMGRAVILVSQRLDDIFAAADEILILRNGRLIASGPRSEFSMEQAIELMLYGEVGASKARPPRLGSSATQSRGANDLALTVERLQVGALEPMSLRVALGEIVGLAGLPGSGPSEFLRALYGLTPTRGGAVTLFGRPMAAASPRRSIARRMAYVTGNRQVEGLVPDASVASNIGMVNNRSVLAGPIGLRRTRHRALRQIDALKISPPDPDAPARGLSGGNQQKVIFARWALSEPRLWLLDDATRGVDIGARHDMHDAIRNCASSYGAATLMVSSDVLEMFEACDRIVVFRNGRVVADVPTDQTTPAEIEAAMTGTEGSRS